MASPTENSQASTTVDISEQDAREVQEMYSKLRAVEAKLVGPGGKTQLLPGNLYSFLCQLLADLKDGKSVTILQSNAALTTLEAAKFLGVSRQFLVNMLEAGQLPFFMVGTHRRLYVRDVLAFKGQRDAARRKILDDLTRSEFLAGHYEVSKDVDSDSQQ